MDQARKHCKILQKLEPDFCNKICEFMVIGSKGDGVLMAIEPDRKGFFYGKMQFGENLNEAHDVPIRLEMIANGLARMAQGYNHIVLLTELGQIYTLGANDWGQLGQGSSIPVQLFQLIQGNTVQFTPQLIDSLERFVEIRCGSHHSLALTDDGKVWAWGRNDFCQVGLSSSTESIAHLRQITELDPYRIVSIECGECFSLALTDQGQVFGWGSNSCGQLAQENLSNVSAPVRLACPHPVTQISAGSLHTLLLAENGLVYACGNNRYGQLGSQTEDLSSFCLCHVPGLPVISKIASHIFTYLSIAMSIDGRCFVWGQWNEAEFFKPLQLPSVYSTIESPLSSELCPTTPYSIRIEDSQSSKSPSTSDSSTQTTALSTPNWLSRMFDNPDSKPDLQFVLGEKSILAHRTVLEISPINCGQLFSTFSGQSPDLTRSTFFSASEFISTRHTTNPSVSELDTTTSSSCSKITQIPINDHSYLAFRSFLRYIYTGLFETSVDVDILPDLFQLSLRIEYDDLQQLCLNRMLSTVSVSTCCQYYQLSDRHSEQLSELKSQVVRFVADQAFRVFRTEAFRSMDLELSKKLALAAAYYEPVS